MDDVIAVYQHIFHAVIVGGQVLFLLPLVVFDGLIPLRFAVLLSVNGTVGLLENVHELLVEREDVLL